MVHGLWELVLALALAGAGYALSQAKPGALGGIGLRELALATTVLGLVAAASAVSLRAGAPNLAVGGVAVFAALYLGQHGSGGWFAPGRGGHRHLRRHRAGAGSGRSRSTGAGVGGEPGGRARTHRLVERKDRRCARRRLRPRAARVLLVWRVLPAERGRERARTGADHPPRIRPFPPRDRPGPPPGHGRGSDHPERHRGLQRAGRARWRACRFGLSRGCTRPVVWS